MQSLKSSRGLAQSNKDLGTEGMENPGVDFAFTKCFLIFILSMFIVPLPSLYVRVSGHNFLSLFIEVIN